MSVDEINNSLKVTGFAILVLTVSMIYVQFRHTRMPSTSEANQFARLIYADELISAKASNLRQHIRVAKPPKASSKEGEKIPLSKIVDPAGSDDGKPVLQFLREKFPLTDRVGFSVAGEDIVPHYFVRVSLPEKMERLKVLHDKGELTQDEYLKWDDNRLLDKMFKENELDELIQNPPAFLANYDVISGSVEAIVDVRDMYISVIESTGPFPFQSTPPHLVRSRIFVWAQEHGIDDTDLAGVLAKYNRMLMEGKPPVNLPLFNIEIGHKIALGIIPFLVWCFFLKYYFLLKQLASSPGVAARNKPFVFLDVWSADTSNKIYFRAERLLLRMLFTSIPVLIVFSAHVCLGLLWFYIKNRSDDITYLIQQTPFGDNPFQQLFIMYSVGLAVIHAVTVPMVFLSLFYLFRVANMMRTAKAAG